MELFQLRCFLAVAEVENVSKAAESIYMSQPALSKVITRLEKEVGVPLFQRTKSSIQLNSNGILFRKYVSESMVSLDEGLRRLKEAAEADSNSVHVVYFGPPTLGDLLEECQTELPGCRLKVGAVPQQDALDAMAQGKADIAIVVTEQALPPETFEVVARQTWVAALTETHPRCGQKLFTPEDMAGEIVCFTGGEEDRSFVETRFAKYGMEPRVFSVHADAKDTARLINQGLAVGLMEDDCFYHRKLSAPRLPLTAASIYGDWSRSIYLGKCADLSETAEKACEKIKSHLQLERRDVDDYMEHQLA